MGFFKKEIKPNLKENENEEEEQQSIGSVIWEYVRVLIVAFVVVVLAETFLVVNAKIPSESMSPTVEVGDQLFGNRLAYINSEPERYDVIIFWYPDDESRRFIKRIIGLPGDVVDIRDGDVYINGSEIPLDDSYCMKPDSTLPGNLTYPITVPDDSYFVLGDNRENSKDSRYWTTTSFVSKDKIQGKAGLRYWPLNRISIVRGYQDGYYLPESDAEEN